MMKVQASATVTASGLLPGTTANSVYHGYTVTVTTATGAINVRRGSVSGQIIDVIPATTAAGSTKSLVYGLAIGDQFGIFVEFNGGATGSVVFHYQ